MKKLIAIIMLTLLASNSAWAIDLKGAKSNGLVGERNDGYLGYVVKPASDEVQALVKDVNTKRKAKFKASAQKNNVTTEQVANRFYQLAVTKTGSGHYYQDASGNWLKK